MPGEDHVVVKEEAERGAQCEADHVDGDVVSQRRGQPEDVVGEQQAELGDADAAGVREEEEDGLARRVLPRASAVGPQTVGDPRVQGCGRGGDELCGVGVPGEEAEGPVLEQVEQAGIDDEGGGSDHAELDEFTHPGEESLREAQGRGRGRSPVILPSGLGTAHRRGRGGLLVDASWSSGLGTRGGGVRERGRFSRFKHGGDGLKQRGRGLKHRGRRVERGGSARGSLFVVHSPSLARPRMRFYRHPSLYGLT